MKAPFCSSRSRAAFSLVEIIISLALISTILIPVICLMALAVSNTQDEASKTGAGCILSTITSDIRSASGTATTSPLYKIQLPAAGAPASSQPTSFYVDADYNVTASLADARYQVNYWTTGSANNHQESIVRIVISWPAPAKYANAQGSVETVIMMNRTL